MKAEVAGFLAQAGWGCATATPLAGDASARRYLRLSDGLRRAVLMEDPEASGVAFAAYRRVGSWLRAKGFSAPMEFAADPPCGLLLLEDLGDDTLSAMLASSHHATEQAYAETANLLIRLSRIAPPAGLANPDPGVMAGMVGLTFDMLPDSDGLRARMLAVLEAALKRIAAPPVLSLRDVHGDNLLWLPERIGPARIGLLDFQDALLLPAGYDLASLVDDPRSDVPLIWRQVLIEEFAKSEGMTRDAAQERVDLMSLQRNLRILGIFRRLSTRFGKAHYAAFLPRTRALLSRAAQAPSLAALRGPVGELLERTQDWAKP